VSTFKPGDRVHWTQTSARGRSLSMTRREGVVVAVSLGGDVADVRIASGKVLQLYTRVLRHEGERGQIDEFVEGVVAANRREAPHAN
jgi:hypothetical protein